MKKILFITAFPPNQRTAGQNYSRSLLNELSKSCEIDLICFQYASHELVLSNNIRVVKFIKLSPILKLCNVLKLPFLHPFFTSRFNFLVLKYLKKTKTEYDVIYFDFSQVFIYSYFIKHPNKILMSHDVIYQKYLRNKGILNFITRPLLRYTENILYKSAATIFCFSNKDQALIKELYNQKAIPVSFYLDEKIRKLSYGNIDFKNYFVFYGAWNREENSRGLHWFLNKVYPFIKPVPIKIIGPALPKELNDMISKEDNIEYCGFVNDPYQYLAEARALIAPLFKGAGVKVKVVETLAIGTPVIGTDIAFEGIDDSGCENMPAFYLTNTAADFITTLDTFPVITKEYKQCLHNNFMKDYSNNTAVYYILN